MKLLKIEDCQGHEHYLNADFIYDITSLPPKLKNQKQITVINLNHKDDDYTFSTFKTHEFTDSIVRRLKELE